MRLSLLLLFFLASFAIADDTNHEYAVNDEVTIWMNKVGPYHNPQETYDYYSQPFCLPEGKVIRHKTNSLGVILEGNELTDSGLKIHFRENQQMTKICDLQISVEVAAQFTKAVQQHYWYQMYIDELPIWGMVGEYMTTDTESLTQSMAPVEQGFLYTHKEFSISYNGNQIIEVNLTSENPRPLLVGAQLPMTYSVTWKPTEKTFAKRFDRYLDFDFFEHQIHWFSIFNSFMMVVFLCGLVALILMRTLRNDYARYTADEDDLELDRVVDESGWKQVHGDVFRAPPYLTLFSAVLGTGYQLFTMAFCVIGITLVGDFHDDRGYIMTTFLVCYSLTSFIAGYVSSNFYKKNGGLHWKKCMIVTSCLLPSFIFVVSSILNAIAFAYESNTQKSFGTVFKMVCIWLFVSCPLLIGGTIVGRSTAKLGDFPCRINTSRRPIPDGHWYTQRWVHCAFAGILPFGSIFIEMYFIFTSFWNYKFYYVYGFMFLVYCILIIVTVCVTIVSTYFLLNAEDHRWHWTSFMSGAATAFYVFLYSIYYFFTKTRMSGSMQVAFYFGYMGMFCFSLALLTGTIGFMGSNIFVRRIYQYIKSD